MNAVNWDDCIIKGGANPFTLDFSTTEATDY